MLRDRTSLLSRPWFLVAIAVLVVNDHILKSAWPGAVTGKVSDFAGLVVVAVLLSVAAGPMWGTIVAGAGFVALKTLPGVAELAVPMLGGLTRRDASDLIALIILPAVWWATTRPRPKTGLRTKRTLQVFGLIAAMLAVSATSQAPEGVEDVWFENGIFLAEVTVKGRLVRFQSEDEGRSWTPEVLPTHATSTRSFPSNEDTVCTKDLTCYRTGWDDASGPREPKHSGSTIIERRVARGKWKPDLRLNGDVFVFDLAVDPHSADALVFGMDESHVAYRTGTQEWGSVDLLAQAEAALDAAPRPLELLPILLVALMPVLLATSLLTLWAQLLPLLWLVLAAGALVYVVSVQIRKRRRSTELR